MKKLLFLLLVISLPNFAINTTELKKRITLETGINAGCGLGFLSAAILSVSEPDYIATTVLAAFSALFFYAAYQGEPASNLAMLEDTKEEAELNECLKAAEAQDANPGKCYKIKNPRGGIINSLLSKIQNS